MSERPKFVGRIAQAMRKLARNARQQGKPNARVLTQNGLEPFFGEQIGFDISVGDGPSARGGCGSAGA